MARIKDINWKNQEEHMRHEAIQMIQTMLNYDNLNKPIINFKNELTFIAGQLVASNEEITLLNQLLQKENKK